MRGEWALLIALLSAPVAAGESYDPAYVDSPQSKALPDPARADAGPVSPAQAQAQAQLQEQHAEEQYIAQQQAETQRHIAAQMEKFNAAQGAAMNGATPYPDPPVGGRDLIGELSATGFTMRQRPDDFQRQAPTPGTATPPRGGIGQQLGSALLQDAAGVVDARIQREIHGPDGRIVLPQQPANPDQPPGW